MTTVYRVVPKLLFDQPLPAADYLSRGCKKRAVDNRTIIFPPIHEEIIAGWWGRDGFQTRCSNPVLLFFNFLFTLPQMLLF